jgi:hypothetical protein
MCTTFWLGNPKGRNHSLDLVVGGWIILKWILSNTMLNCGLDSSGIRLKPEAKYSRSFADNIKMDLKQHDMKLWTGLDSPGIR